MRKLNYVMPRHGGILFVSDKKKRLTMALLTVCGMEFVGVAHCHPGNLNHPKGDKWDKGKGKLIAGNRALKKYYDQPFSVRNGFVRGADISSDFLIRFEKDEKNHKYLRSIVFT